jgi:ribosomal-protein-alanine N-acetyltransferase
VAAAPGWPARLERGRVGLRPLRFVDGPAWADLRRRNADWLSPWEATPPDRGWAAQDSIGVYLSMLSSMRHESRRGLALPWGLTYDGALVGQLAVSSIVRGALNSGSLGYWVDERRAGRGIMTIGLALAVDHCFGPARLHRVEANIRPENLRSRRLVERLGFRDEGLRRRLLHINGSYRDHHCYALTQEDAPEGLVARLRTLQHTPHGPGAG